MSDELVIDAAAVAETIETFIRQSVDAFAREGAIVGLSGGIDSAVVTALAARALGPQQVLALLMPDRDSDPLHERHARQLAAQLGVRHQKVSLTGLLARIGIYRQVPLWVVPWRRWREGVVKHYYAALDEQLGSGQTPFSAIMVGTRGLQGPWLNQAVAYHRVKVRLRMVLLYYYAELHNLLVLGTVNKTERSVGIFVKHGDAAADIAPIADLYKTQVRQLAAFLDLPRQIIEKPPSPDLIPGLTDEGAVGVPYELLDRILWRLEAGKEPAQIAEALGVEVGVVEYVEGLTKRSEHMRQDALRPSLG